MRIHDYVTWQLPKDLHCLSVLQYPLCSWKCQWCRQHEAYSKNWIKLFGLKEKSLTVQDHQKRVISLSLGTVEWPQQTTYQSLDLDVEIWTRPAQTTQLEAPFIGDNNVNFQGGTLISWPYHYLPDLLIPEIIFYYLDQMAKFLYSINTFL